MNITFRPFNVDTDKETISQFLVDTKKMTGTLPEDPQKDCDIYVSAIQNTQKRSNEFCVLVISNNITIGFIDIFASNKNPQVGFLRFIYIIKSFRRKGLGSIIMEYINKIMEKHSCKKIYLDVSKNNEIALAFYQKYGFKFLGKAKNNHLRMFKDFIIQ